ncbi:MAG: signal peptide protein [Candidatus Magnetoglobus multicellularis str. Araruama]|uniref:Signal peptide protein n=1 Tax=Candidatus Magnetoglobus multicellularis str. Araruama TaxID=890399 RepID=A0A1V1PBV3_9BACT|nr:MAG: signal peptide protein [Candidatus Magnetoglobus multicellularis str. Araruama]
MQIDIHFYGTFCLARAAGITAETAHTIAMASQFINDATTITSVLIENKRCIRPLRTSFKGCAPPYSEDDSWRVWVPFHFLPGNEPEDGPFTERIVCRKNSLIAQKLAVFALKEDHGDIWPYLIGITAHAYADTFSHYGFSGIAHQHNKIVPDSISLDNNHQDLIAEYLATKSLAFHEKYLNNAHHLPTGHSQVATYPDRPFLKWRYEMDSQKSSKIQWRDNTADFMEACECLYYFFHEYIKKNPEGRDPKGHKKWTDIAPIIRFILGVEAPCDQRIPVWKRNLLSGIFCELTPVDQDLHYDRHRWQLNRARWASDDSGESIEKSHAYLFYKAARVYQRYVLEELLVDNGLLG